MCAFVAAASFAESNLIAGTAPTIIMHSQFSHLPYSSILLFIFLYNLSYSRISLHFLTASATFQKTISVVFCVNIFRFGIIGIDFFT